MPLGETSTGDQNTQEASVSTGIQNVTELGRQSSVNGRPFRDNDLLLDREITRVCK